MDRAETVFESIGGEQTISRLVVAFYARVQAHPQLANLFPDDISLVRDKQYAFLTQFFGGPHLYSQQYGPPMMRAKHLPHPVTPDRAREWLWCMWTAMDDIGLDMPIREYMFERLMMTARHMVNRDG